MNLNALISTSILRNVIVPALCIISIYQKYPSYSFYYPYIIQYLFIHQKISYLLITLSIHHSISYLLLIYLLVIHVLYPTYPYTIHMLYNILPSRILSICYTISFLLLNYRYIIHTSYYILPVAYSGLGCSWLPDPCGLFSWSPGNTCRGLPVRPTGTWWGWLGFGFCAHTGNPT